MPTRIVYLFYSDNAFCKNHNCRIYLASVVKGKSRDGLAQISRPSHNW